MQSQGDPVWYNGPPLESIHPLWTCKKRRSKLNLEFRKPIHKHQWVKMDADIEILKGVKVKMEHNASGTILRDENNKPVALYRKFRCCLSDQTDEYRLYSFSPVYDGQEPESYHGVDVYFYGNAPRNGNVYLVHESRALLPAYVVDFRGRTITSRDGQTIASWEKQADTNMIHTDFNDIGLVLCLVTVADGLYQDFVEESMMGGGG